MVGLPAELGPLVGRDRERARVAELLATTRMLTLTGPGGSGKTRLALRVATDAIPSFQDGACWVELGGTSDPATVSTVVATALGVRDHRGDLTGALAEHLEVRRSLLVLDSCEHLVEACSALATWLLRACPALVVLATSREPLSTEGEVTFEVPPLGVPGREARSAVEVLAAEAPRLFEARAQQARPDFEVTDQHAAAVAEICRRLDGLPLAIELAAARVRVLTPAQIAAGLTDRFRLLTGGGRGAAPRHQALAASVAWSYELLGADERLALARLSSFAGEPDLDAAEAVVAAGDLDAASVLDLVTALAERSLLQVVERHGRAHYRMLETIRLYARQRLTELDDPARVRDRHLQYHVELAERAGAGLAGPDAESWMARLADALDDLLAALDWAVASHQPLAVLDIVEPSIRFWFERGLHPTAQRWLGAALDAPMGDDVAGRLVAASLLEVRAGNHSLAHAFADRAVAPARAAHEVEALALGLVLRAWAGARSAAAGTGELLGDAEEAVALIEAPREGPIDPATAAHVLIFAGLVAQSLDALPTSRRLLEQAVAVCEQWDVAYHRGTAHAVLGLWTGFTGDLDRARHHARQGVEASLQVDRPGFAVYGTTGLAVADILQGRERAAAAHLERARQQVRSSGLELTIYDLNLRHWMAVAAHRFGDDAQAARLAEQNGALARDRQSRWDEAFSEWLLATLALRQKRLDDAVGHAERCRDLSSDPRYPFLLGRSLLGLAHARHTAGGHEDEAWEHAHDALGELATYGDLVGTVDALEAIGALATELERPEHGLRLLGAADRFRARSHIPRFPIEVDRHEGHLTAAASRLEPDEAQRCRLEGEAISVDEAVAYARRGRGERGRPQSGWQSLTPAEREAARLVADGCTNAEIGERLFVSPHTVKKHLSSAYAKLGLDGRAGLAAEVTKRER